MGQILCLTHLKKAPSSYADRLIARNARALAERRRQSVVPLAQRDTITERITVSTHRSLSRDELNAMTNTEVYSFFYPDGLNGEPVPLFQSP